MEKKQTIEDRDNQVRKTVRAPNNPGIPRGGRSRGPFSPSAAAALEIRLTVAPTFPPTPPPISTLIPDQFVLIPIFTEFSQGGAGEVLCRRSRWVRLDTFLLSRIG